MSDQIWLLGATGRTGTAIGARLVAAGRTPVLVGRNADRLRAAASEMGIDDPQLVVEASIERIVQVIREQRPAVVVNTIGGYAETATTIARACLPGGHYVDLANELGAIPRLLELSDEAADNGSTFVTGAGFGVLGTQAVVAKLCEGQPTPSAVRVDAMASFAMEAGPLGTALAESIVSGLTTGGLRYQGGRLVKARLASEAQQFNLPDGETASTVLVPTGDLLAAQQASNAPAVVSANALLPGGAVRHLLPLIGGLLAIPALRRLAVRRLAAVTTKAAPRAREHSWGHAVVTWPDGTTRAGWLRCDDAMDFTCAVSTEAALALARGEAKPGAHTPVLAFGADLAVAAGATFILE
ncbi:hypothetical protein E1263_00375 [Kribbella antibiotica]|uniref:Saccharopine dehydrogenase NADP binding domain-containing protein n=1 Tax=Kribbella antibiotica TaxID=190195 RepID=A0A4R5A1W2_9ACTN|nr:hypothetical protein [Kribbella antibiotica]TDD63442.1 hypothetical protein E1263_00375 [Kribbella antibiotica]